VEQLKKQLEAAVQEKESAQWELEVVKQRWEKAEKEREAMQKVASRSLFLECFTYSWKKKIRRNWPLCNRTLKN
jgi:hypothetical protein